MQRAILAVTIVVSFLLFSAIAWYHSNFDSSISESSINLPPWDVYLIAIEFVIPIAAAIAVIALAIWLIVRGFRHAGQR